MAQLSSSPKGYCAGTRSRFFTWRGSPGGLHHATRYFRVEQIKETGKEKKKKKIKARYYIVVFEK